MTTENTLKGAVKGQEANQTCCLGLLLMSEAANQRRTPVCVGVKQKNDTIVGLPDIPEHLRNDHGKLQFMCLGYSIYEQVDARHAKDAGTSGRATLPYCEGVEVIRVEVAPGSERQGPATEAATSASQNRPPFPASRPPLPSSRTSQPDTGPPPLDWSDFAHRYLKSAQRTLLRMQLTWNHMYNAAFKPLVDKVLGDKDDKPP